MVVENLHGYTSYNFLVYWGLVLILLDVKIQANKFLLTWANPSGGSGIVFCRKQEIAYGDTTHTKLHVTN